MRNPLKIEIIVRDIVLLVIAFMLGVMTAKRLLIPPLVMTYDLREPTTAWTVANIEAHIPICVSGSNLSVVTGNCDALPNNVVRDSVFYQSFDFTVPRAETYGPPHRDAYILSGKEKH